MNKSEKILMYIEMCESSALSFILFAHADNIRNWMLSALGITQYREQSFGNFSFINSAWNKMFGSFLSSSLDDDDL